MRPKEYEFSMNTKVEALRRADWKCERCGKSKKDVGLLEIHHLLPVMIAVKYYPHILPELVASLDNAMCVCEECHPYVDQESRDTHPMLALKLYSEWLESQVRLERAAKQLEEKRLNPKPVQRRLF